MHYEKFADGTVKCIEEEIPFELPERWEWCRLGVITEIYGRIGFRGYTKDDLVEIGEGAITLSPSNIINSKLDFSSCTYISWVKYDESPEIQLAKNDIVLVKTGSSYGKSAIVDKLPEKTTLNPQFVVLKNTKINSSYACMYLQSTHSQNLFREFVVGTAIPTFSQKALSTLLISCPPISEQHRIVEKLNELLSFVDTIESDKTDLQKIIQQTKSKILDLAIRGKLVPQDPNDEPASVLLERIRTEKEELIKQGKIKRDKKESVIFKGEDNSYYEKVGSEVRCIDEELPFEVPDSWIWCRLENCCNKEIKRGKSPKYAETGSTLVFAQKCNTKYSGIDIGLSLFLDNSILCKYPNTEFMQDGDIVINSTGTGTLGRVGIYRSVDNRKRLPIVPDSHITIIRTYKSLLADYVYAYMKASQSQLEKMGEGSTNQKELKPLTLKNFLIPIPPKEEQKAIASKIAALFSYLDSIAELLD